MTTFSSTIDVNSFQANDLLEKGERRSVGWSHNGPSPAAEPDAFSELDRGPLGGGAAPITASGATAGILSGPHAHPPEPAVSGTVNRAGPVTDRDTRRIFFLFL